MRVRIDHRGRGDHKVWRLWWRDGEGRKRTIERRGWTMAQATDAARRLQRELNHQGCPWDDFAARYLAYQARRNRPATVAGVRQVLAQFHKQIDISRVEEVSRPMINCYLDALTLSGARPASRNRHLRVLRAAFDWATAEQFFFAADGGGLVTRNPADGLRPLKETRLPHTILPARSACEQLAKEIGKDGPRWETAVRLGMDCGLRVAELGHLTWGSVDLARREIAIQPEPDGWRPKGTPGLAAFGDRVAALLATLRKAARGSAGDVDDAARVLGGRSPGYFVHAFRLRLKQACIRAGLPPILPHGLRRTFGTILANEGMQAAQLQRVMRHADIKTTMDFYVRVDDRRAAHEALRKLEEAD